MVLAASQGERGCGGQPVEAEHHACVSAMAADGVRPGIGQGYDGLEEVYVAVLIRFGLAEVDQFLDEAYALRTEAAFFKNLAIGSCFHVLARLDSAGGHLHPGLWAVAVLEDEHYGRAGGGPKEVDEDFVLHSAR